LRSAISLGRLWRDQGRPGEARTQLLSVYRRFSEGLETADLREAKGLLSSRD
jgi:predicted ATPase